MTVGKESGSAGVLVAYCDGGSRGNPGPSGYGVFLQGEDGSTVGELSDFLGVKTNNVAEYAGLLAALGFALEHGHTHLRVVSDSELMVKQMKGQYRVNSPDLKPLYEEAKRRAGQLKKFEMQHVLRGKNKEADRLANEAMDRGTGRGAAGRPVPMWAASGIPAKAASGTAAKAASGDAKAGSEAVPRVTAGVALGAKTSPARAALAPPSPPEGDAFSPKDLSREVTGFVKNGVVHLVEGELPEGTFVRVLPARR